jgi:TonB family protein
MKLSVVLFGLILSASSFAQEPPAGVFRPGRDGTPPVLTDHKEPGYSEEARLAKMQGTVTLFVVIGEDGKAKDIRVLKSLGLGLDEEAVEAVSKWQFRPGMKDGQPVEVRSTIEVNFRLLDDPREWSVKTATFTTSPGGTRPRLVKAPHPPLNESSEPASVRIAFDVDKQGVPTDIQVVDSSDPKWNDEAIELIRGWLFEPASEDGAAIAAHAEFQLKRGGESPSGATAVKKQ